MSGCIQLKWFKYCVYSTNHPKACATDSYWEAATAGLSNVDDVMTNIWESLYAVAKLWPSALVMGNSSATCSPSFPLTI
ncbi:hypothetical protein NSPZN2_40324 [Nitrospira defluvii]|uniref:Uncharacterized protein n=1 Tax=Nitrospira defluvii TaxID=330214 RepID=A0ABM8RU84_9BACT|nr:hypothetical protein NSPZN2_40324 [Nitrospira defluvii]